MQKRFERTWGVAMKSSEILREAKKHLWNGKGKFVAERKSACVCGAVMSALASSDESGDGLKIYIDSVLDGQVFISSWLANVAKIPWHQITTENLQAYRLRWMDHMIEIFEAKGD
jgi:hypothetical protein